MASQDLTLQEIYEFFTENGGKVKNKDAVRYFKKYLTDPATKTENRTKFKEYINTLAHTRTEGDEKVLILKTKYLHSFDAPLSPLSPLSTSNNSLNVSAPESDPRNAIGIPTSPINKMNYEHFGSTASLSTPPRQPPPYRNPPPVISPSPSLDSISISSNSLDERPQAPPRRKGNLEDQRYNLIGNSLKAEGDEQGSKGNLEKDKENSEMMRTNGVEEDEEEKEVVSVKERTQKFNRLASVEDELSPRTPKSAEKDRSRNWGSEEIDTSTLTPLEPKKCQEWYVTASRGDYQELLKLARDEPRLVNKKDPFSAYTVLHWGAKHGNANIIKTFAGYYKVDVNSLTNGGYTPLHISAQFGHKDIFKLLIEVYKADTNIRDYSGRTAEYYLLTKEQKENNVTLRKIKGRKKQSDKDLGFLRIGSLNVRVKKTTEAFSNFLGVGNSVSINPSDSMTEKVHKGWGSADNVNKDSSLMAAPKGYVTRKKSKRPIDSGLSSTPSTPKTPVKNYSTTSLPITGQTNDSDSDGAAGFDSNWKR